MYTGMSEGGRGLGAYIPQNFAPPLIVAPSPNRFLAPILQLAPPDFRPSDIPEYTYYRQSFTYAVLILKYFLTLQYAKLTKAQNFMKI